MRCTKPAKPWNLYVKSRGSSFLLFLLSSVGMANHSNLAAAGHNSLTNNPSSINFGSVTASDASRIDPVWAFYIDDNVPGKYYLQAGWGWGGVTLAGPYAGDPVSGKYYTQRVAPCRSGSGCTWKRSCISRTLMMDG